MRSYSQSIWWYNLRPDLSTTRVMPDTNTRITQAENGVLITGNGYIRWISNSFFDDVDTDRL